MSKNDFFVAGIGASAGGHHALKEFFQHFPYSTDISFVIVTHLLRDHASILHRILSRYTRMEVKRITRVEVVQPGKVYVMPENVKLVMRDGALITRPREPDEVINKTIDIFLHCLAEDRRENAVAIIFSGMGSDGAEGVQSIHAAGGTVLVQEPKSTDFKSMPNAAIASDHPQEILPPGELAKNLARILEEKRIKQGSLGYLDRYGLGGHVLSSE